MIIRPLTIMAEKPTPSGISLLPLSSWTNASLSNLTNWKNNYGDTNVWIHSPAMQASKFLEPPECRMTYTH